MKSNMERKIYLSGPITGYDLEERKKEFGRMKDLVQDYYCREVLNPMENGLPDDATTCEHMRKDLEMLLTCDAILLMKGWERSAGCLTELNVAKACGMDVWFEEVIDVL